MFRSKIILLPILYILSLFFPFDAVSQEKQTVRLSTWPSLGKNAGFYVAQSRGIYDDHKIEFSFIHSRQSTVNPILTGDADVAQVLCSEAVRLINEGAPLLVVGARDASFPVGTVSLASSDVRSPSDYAGKRWGRSAGIDAELQTLNLLADLNSFDVNSVTSVHVEFPARIPALIRGDVDVVSAWWGSGFPIMQAAAHAQGVKLSFIKWSDFGIDLYGECFVVTSTFASANGELLRRFLEATKVGFEVAIAEPSSAVAAILSEVNQKYATKQLVEATLNQSSDLLFDKFTKRMGLFWIDTDKFKRTMATVPDIRLERPIEEYFSIDYL